MSSLLPTPSPSDRPPSRALRKEIRQALEAGGLVALPTETVYGLAANATQPAALEALRELNILIDGGQAQGGGFLLQIFSKESIGPIFFEFIQRKDNEGFGEGNFQALFESIEADQIKRGVVRA